MDDLLVTKRPLSEVPADQSFFQPGPISERIEFPIEARARMGLLAWFLVPLGALCLGLSAFILADLPKSLHSPYDLLHTTIGATAFFVFGLSFIAAFLTLIYDRMKEAPLLILDAEGLLDRRSLQTIIPWSQIANAKIYVQGVTWGYAALRLKLRAPIDARHNPFRVGTPWFYAWRRRPDEIWVPILDLDVPARTLGVAITTMVRRHGGTIEKEKAKARLRSRLEHEAFALGAGPEAEAPIITLSSRPSKPAGIANSHKQLSQVVHVILTA